MLQYRGLATNRRTAGIAARRGFTAPGGVAARGRTRRTAGNRDAAEVGGSAKANEFASGGNRRVEGREHACNEDGRTHTAGIGSVGLRTRQPPRTSAPKISISSLLGPVTLSGFGDMYYGYDANHPGNNQSGLRFFEAPTNGFSFNMAELVLDKPPDATSPDSRLGYHVAAGYGQAAKIVNGSDAPFSDGSNFFLKEAYISYLAPVGKGLTLTVGKFVTNAGDEVIESNANWNYSRSILFYYAIPFFHFGAKASYTINPKWSVNASLFNGWNNTVISHASGPNGFNSSGLTYGGSVDLHAKHEVVRDRELLRRTRDHRGECRRDVNQQRLAAPFRHGNHVHDEPEVGVRVERRRRRTDSNAEERNVVGCGGVREIHVEPED